MSHNKLLVFFVLSLIVNSVNKFTELRFYNRLTRMHMTFEIIFVKNCLRVSVYLQDVITRMNALDDR